MKTISLKLSQLLTVGVCVLAQPLWAYHDDAYSYAMEAAEPEAKRDVYIREDFWSGTTKSGDGESQVAQLFRGNTYWFWVGTVPEDTKISLEVRDAAGKILVTEGERKTDGRCAIFFKPTQSGAYTIRVQVTSATERFIDWVLAYGYE